MRARCRERLCTQVPQDERCSGLLVSYPVAPLPKAVLVALARSSCLHLPLPCTHLLILHRDDPHHPPVETPPLHALDMWHLLNNDNSFPPPVAPGQHDMRRGSVNTSCSCPARPSTARPSRSSGGVPSALLAARTASLQRCASSSLCALRAASSPGARGLPAPARQHMWAPRAFCNLTKGCSTHAACISGPHKLVPSFAC